MKRIAACTTGLMLLAAVLAANSLADEIKATIDQVSGDTITISTSSDVLPVAGDKLTIYVDIPGVGKASVGTGTVVEVNGGAITGRVVQSSARVAKGQFVAIESAKPVRHTGARVPALVGQTAQDAKKALADAGYEADFIIGTAAPKGIAPFTVQSQDPAAETPLAKGGKVAVTLYAQGDSAPPPADPGNAGQPSGQEFPPHPLVKPNQPWLGISRWNVNNQVVICGVLKDGPAGKAGLRTDDTILSLDGEKIAGNQGLHDFVDRHKPGDTIAVELVRDGQTQTVPVVLEPIPPDGGNGRILAAAKAGESWAMMDIGVRYAHLRGNVSYFEQNPENDAEAVRWFHRATEAGYTAGPLFLAHMYRLGRGVGQDYAKALELFQQARSLQGTGVRKGVFESATNSMALFYSNGWSVPQDYQQAAALYGEAADRGSLLAQHQLGKMYETGQGVTQNQRTAMDWFYKAAKEGYRNAQYDMGLIAYEGKGVQRNYQTALNWFKLAADGGYAPAIHYLGLMYENGQGVSRDDAQAVEYYRQAARQGNEQSRAALQRLGIEADR